MDTCVYLVQRGPYFEPCGAEAAAGPPLQLHDRVPLCASHADRVKWDVYGAQKLAESVKHADMVASARERKEAESVVYFLQREDGLVKVGYTGNFRSRLSQLQREHGPLQIIGLRRGGPVQEAALHAKFRAHLAWRKEWFRPDPPVLREASKCRLKIEALRVAA